jgi:transposase-like protein
MQDTIIKQFKKLPSAEQLKLIKRLESQIGNETKLLSFRTGTERPQCLYCKSFHVIKFGTYSNKSKPRYRCKDCKKTFSNFTGTSVYNVKKKHLWMSFIKLMLENKSIREISKQLHLSTATVFNWRHRALCSFEKTFTREFKGIVETDDVFLKFNQKGRRKNFKGVESKKRGISDQQVAVMVLADRYRTLDMKTTKLGRIRRSDLDRVIDKSRLNKDNIICSDMHPTIEGFVKSLDLPHVQIKSSANQHVKDGLYHINKVNSLASELKRWLNRNFINVSTKYLQNYLYLFEMQQIMRNDENKLEFFLGHSLRDDRTYDRKKRVEERYEEFLSY